MSVLFSGLVKNQNEINARAIIRGNTVHHINYVTIFKIFISGAKAVHNIVVLCIYKIWTKRVSSRIYCEAIQPHTNTHPQNSLCGKPFILNTKPKPSQNLPLNYRIVQNFDGGKFWRILTFQIFDGKYFDRWWLSFTIHL